MCVFCHLLEKDDQAGKADRQCGRGCVLLPPPSLSQGWAECTAELVSCQDTLGFLLDPLNLHLGLSLRDFPTSLLRSGPSHFWSLHHQILWLHSLGTQYVHWDCLEVLFTV